MPLVVTAAASRLKRLPRASLAAICERRLRYFVTVDMTRAPSLISSDSWLELFYSYNPSLDHSFFFFVSLSLLENHEGRRSQLQQFGAVWCASGGRVAVKYVSRRALVTRRHVCLVCFCPSKPYSRTRKQNFHLLFHSHFVNLPVKVSFTRLTMFI